MTCITQAQTLLAQLSIALGARSASREFKWMKDHARDIQALQGMVHRRLKGEPLQYILGTQPFGSLDLKVRAPVLIPRTETEDWTIRLARLLLPSLKLRPRSRRAPLKLLDLCTGSGCIPLLLCHMWPPNSVHALGVDIANEAIALANDNADRTKQRLNNSVSFQQADILDDSFPRILEEWGWLPVDVLTSNPPYIPSHEYNVLPSSVRNYEDPRALLGDPSPTRATGDGRGLTFYRRIADLIRDGLVSPGGRIALEVGHDQSKEVEDIMQSQANVCSTETWNDPFGIPRTVICRK